MKFTGISAFAGKEIGRVLRINSVIAVDKNEKFCAGEEEEYKIFKNSVATTLDGMVADRQRFLTQKQQTKADIVNVQITLLKDNFFQNKVKEVIAEGFSASAAVARTVQEGKNALLKLKSDYMKERSKDIEDMGYRLIGQMHGQHCFHPSSIAKDTIIVADDLFPSLLMNVEPGNLQGIILEKGSATSHAVILAGSMEIPTLVQCAGAEHLKSGDTVFLNAVGGYVEGPISKERSIVIQDSLLTYHKCEKDLKNARMLPAKTADGERVQILANITNENAGKKVLQSGADGVGLFRTEFLFMNRSDLPSENEQFECYRSVAEGLNGRPLTIRTIDIGADKKAESLGLEKEQNPALGYRAIRICADHKELFLTQLRACLRASSFGKIKIMFPMISNFRELKMAKSALQEAKKQLETTNQKYDQSIKIGIMIEIPSAALMADQFAKEVDFFSIGSNDLTQYTLAVDRLNPKVNYLYDSLNPAVLQLIARTIQAAANAKIECSLCGEMAADPLAIPLLLGFGLKHFSMNSGKIALAKELISLLDIKQLVPFSQNCLGERDSDTISERMKSFLSPKYLKWIS